MKSSRLFSIIVFCGLMVVALGLPGSSATRRHARHLRTRTYRSTSIHKRIHSSASSASSASTGTSVQAKPVEAWRVQWIKEWTAKEEARQTKLHAEAAERARHASKTTPGPAAAVAPILPATTGVPAARPIGLAAAPSTAQKQLQTKSQSPVATPAAVQPTSTASASAGPHSATPLKPAQAKPLGPRFSTTPAARPGPTVPAAPTGKPKSDTPGLVLTQTKPDIAPASELAQDHTIDSPMRAVGDGWKLVAYLIPTLIFVLVCLNVLRKYQQKTGRLPGPIQSAANTGRKPANSLAGGLAALFSGNKNGKRGDGGSRGIRLVESLTVGTSALHLVQVRGRALLLAGSPTGVTVLTEFQENETGESHEFRQALQAAAADMDGLDLADDDMPVSAVVGSLEDTMRDTSDSLERRLRRLRTVREAEDGGHR